MYFMLVAFISPVKFSKALFSVWTFVRSLKFYYKNKTVIAIKITWNQTFLPQIEYYSKKRRNSLSVFHRNYLNTATIIGKLELTQILRREDYRITLHHSARLQTTKHTLTTWKHSNEFTYSDFPCY